MQLPCEPQVPWTSDGSSHVFFLYYHLHMHEAVQQCQQWLHFSCSEFSSLLPWLTVPADEVLNTQDDQREVILCYILWHR